MADRVKIVDFSKAVPLSRSRDADHGALRGSASFALSHEKVWSKVRWLIDQVNLYSSLGGAEAHKPPRFPQRPLEIHWGAQSVAPHPLGTRRAAILSRGAPEAALPVPLCRRRRAEASPDASRGRQSPRFRRLTTFHRCRCGGALNSVERQRWGEAEPRTASVHGSGAAASDFSSGCRQHGQLHQLAGAR